MFCSRFWWFDLHASLRLRFCETMADDLIGILERAKAEAILEETMLSPWIDSLLAYRRSLDSC